MKYVPCADTNTIKRTMDMSILTVIYCFHWTCHWLFN